jgi:hypothetical protein
MVFRRDTRSSLHDDACNCPDCDSFDRYDQWKSLPVFYKATVKNDSALTVVATKSLRVES